jgi:methylenetetrahydrofolate--tRNA-(uracil-5-)-methyltransferase
MTDTADHTQPVHVIGGGLAGSEAAWQIAQAGVSVVLHEMRPIRGTDAHLTDGLAELVCSNSFRSDDAETNAVGVLHAEMRLAWSLIMACGDRNQVPAGGALAVDRVGFSDAVTKALNDHPLVTIEREEVTGLPPVEWGRTIIATGPLTAPDLAAAIQAETGGDALAFFDAIAPSRLVKSRVRMPSPSSMRSRRSSTPSPSTWISAGISRATTRSAPAARARTISTAR